ncbi:hypothetical protein QVD17_41470 [Tagetes erecta]|uniref:Uncharacterized protein n=1 Tax=Tagetes erecta TaxID=13708 RepID=A0AAD8JPC1_TARER|nr:hypothetical protein QVD17_41470 [Tagetes erecta]
MLITRRNSVSPGTTVVDPAEHLKVKMRSDFVGVHLQLRVSLVNILQTKIGKRTHMQKTISAPKCSLGHENSPN